MRREDSPLPSPTSLIQISAPIVKSIEHANTPALPSHVSNYGVSVNICWNVLFGRGRSSQSPNLLDEEAREPAVPWTAQRNTDATRKARGGGGRNETNTTINPSGKVTIHTSGRRGGVAGGAGEEGGGEQGERGKRRRRRHEGEERRALLRLLFLGEGGGGALASSSPLEER